MRSGIETGVINYNSFIEKEDMITVQEAENAILKRLYIPCEESVKLEQSAGRILREPLTADRPFPPFDRVSMDGIAISFDAYANGQRLFPVKGVAAAGAPQVVLHDPSGCIEVMTGAVTPAGADTVIRYEDISVEDGVAKINIEDVHRHLNVHGEGSDRSLDEVIVPAGIRMTPAEIGVAASVGKSFLKVATLPRVVVISTGDELVEVEAQPLPHQIRKSNEYQISAALLGRGIRADRRYIEDTKEEVDRVIAECLKQYDVMILSGGVSAGKFDYIPKAMQDNGVEKHFHKISQRPGKPFWFGSSDEHRTTVFALPGNPVSSFMCTVRYIIPWLDASMQVERRNQQAVLMEDYHFHPDLTYFLQVRTEVDSAGRICAYPETGGGSGDLANLVRADSFLELPRGRNDFKAGEVFPLYSFRQQ